jgi:hypothetical protein
MDNAATALSRTDDAYPLSHRDPTVFTLPLTGLEDSIKNRNPSAVCTRLTTWEVSPRRRNYNAWPVESQRLRSSVNLTGREEYI